MLFQINFNFKIIQLDEIGVENLLNIFSLMPELIKEKKATFKPETVKETDPEIIKLEAELAEARLEEMDLNEPIETVEKRYERLFVLKKENLSSKSKICQQDIHRKMFSDTFVLLLRHQVFKSNLKLNLKQIQTIVY